MIEAGYDLLRTEVKSELINQEGKYNPDDRDTNVRIVEDIRKAIDGVANGIMPSATHIAEVAIATNVNLHIRDFIMGIQQEKDINSVGQYIALLTNVISKDKAIPLATIFCGYLYQIEDIEQAKATLLDVLTLNPEYALAKLLSRVFMAEWPTSEFSKIAEKLHPSVVDTIYAVETKEIDNDN